MRRSSAVFISGLVLAGLSACGGGGSDAVPGVPPTTMLPTVTTQPGFANLSFNQPLALKQAPGDASRWFVAEKGGRIHVFANSEATTSPSLFLDLSSVVNASGEGGLLGFAFHPDFPTTPEVFVSYTRSDAVSPLVSVVSRFFSTDIGLTLNPASEEVILTVAQPATNHNGGELEFGPDGWLYIGFGDGGGSGDPDGNAQNTSNLMGAIVRLDVEGGSPYAIPAGNPFEANAVCSGGSGSSACPEIYAWGLRNPWRFSFDRVAGTLWAGDVGQNDWEEVDRITVNSNYGWNVREGAHCFSPPTGCAETFEDPITEYDHGLGQSVTGGFVYRGTAISELAGRYVFGDFVTGRLFGIPADSAPGVVPDELADTTLSIVSFGQDVDGELYLLDFGVGTIHKLVNAR